MGESGHFEVTYILILGTLLILLFVVVMVVLLLFFNKEKTKSLLKQQKLEADFQKNLNNAKVEIAENNLKNISQELHDNIGQLLTVASLESKMLSTKKEDVTKHDIQELSEVITNALEEIRHLSKSLNTNYLQQIKFKTAIVHELERIERLGVISTSHKISDDIILKKEIEIILFRMIQEFISNSIKHSQAESLKIEAFEEENNYIFIAQDNGIGFNNSNILKSNGLLNIEDRAKAIGAKLSIASSEGHGCKMTIILKKQTDEKTQNHYS